MTFSSEYVDGKTPIGVVFAVTTDKLKIVNLSEGTSLAWCLDSADGYNCNPATDTADGSGNWQKICNTEGINDATSYDGSPSDNYPAFKYVIFAVIGRGGNNIGKLTTGIKSVFM